MDPDLGWVDLGVRPDASGFDTTLNRQLGGIDRTGNQIGSRFSAGFKKAALIGVGGLATAAVGVLKVSMDSVEAASNLEESTNKVDQIFGKAADSIFRFSSTTADALGQSNNEARSAAATFGIFGKAADLNDRQAAKFSKRMVTLASDLASFNNTEPDQAVEALGAALRGESEPIRAYGVMLDEATLKAEALALGILKPVKDQSKIFAYQTRITDLQKSYNETVAEHGKDSLEALKVEASLGTARTALQKATEGTLPPLTQQQKLLAAQSQIFKQTEVAQGDFARTSDGLANQQRRMAARFEDTKAALGKGLLPIMNDAAGFILEEGIPAFERFADWFNDDGIPALKDAAEFGRDAASAISDLVGFLNDLPDPAKYAGLAALVGGGVALKVRGGGGGALGSAGSALGLAKPVPVFVTNQGFGGADGGGAGGRSGGARLALGAVTTVAVAAAGTVGIERLSQKLAPETTKNGNWGTPNSGAALGTTNDGGGIIDMTGFLGVKDTDGKKADKGIDGLIAKVDVFKGSLDLVGSTKVRPDLAVPGLQRARDGLAEFISQQVEARKPVTPYINTTPIERALGLIRTMNAELAAQAVPERGVDNGATYQHGGTPAASNRRHGHGGARRP